MYDVFKQKFIDKTISMLEYDPVRRASEKQKINITITKPTQKKQNQNKNKSSQYHIDIDVLKKETQKLENVTIMDEDDLYEEIEFLYKLTYIRDVICWVN